MSILLIFSLTFVSPVSAEDSDTGTLKPGQVVTFEQTVPINIVFIGYNKKDIDKQTLLNGRIIA